MFDITEQDCETITKLRWLQVKELALQDSKDPAFGSEVRKLIKK